MKTGELIWFDIPVTNFDKAMGFYGELFGWRFEPLGDPKNAEYWLIKMGDEGIGGLRKPEVPILESDAPILYFAVEQLEESVVRAKNLGGERVGKRVDIGNDMGSYHWIRDRDKNIIALWSKS